MHAMRELQRHPVAARLLTRRMLAVFAAVLLIVAYVALRAPANPVLPLASKWDPLVPTLLDWTILASLLAVFSPRAGLLVLVAIGPYADPVIVRQVFAGDLNVSDDLRAKSIIAVCLLVGVIVRVIASSMGRRAVVLPPAPSTTSAPDRSVAGVPDDLTTVEPPAVLSATPPVAAVTAVTAVAVPPEVRWIDRFGRLGDPAIVIGLAAVLVLGTGLSLFAVSVRIEPTFARQAIGVWLGGIVTPFAALFAAAWLARRGDRSTIVMVVVAALVAGAIGVIDHLAKGTFDGTALAWTIEAGALGEKRLNGVVGLPNAAATMLLAPIAILGALVARDIIRAVARLPGVGRLLTALVDPRDALNDDGPRDPRIRWAATICAVGAAGVLALTFSRSALAAVLAMVVVVAWRQGRKLALSFILVGLLVGLLLVPKFLAQRGDAGVTPPGGNTGLLTKGDADRVRAWKAAVLMWEDAPLGGHGFYTYKLLHKQYGEGRVTAPHNEWLRFFAEEGLFVGLAGVGFVIFGFLALARVRGYLATGILGVFVGYVLMASFNNPLTYGQVGLMVLPVVGVGLGLAWVARAGAVPVARPAPQVATDQGTKPNPGARLTLATSGEPRPTRSSTSTRTRPASDSA